MGKNSNPPNIRAAQPATELDYRLQVMMDLLKEYFGNKATHAEWVAEIQKRFVGPDSKLRRGWSDDSIDRKITKLEAMGLIRGGRGLGKYYSVVEKADNTAERSQAAQPRDRIQPSDRADDKTETKPAKAEMQSESHPHANSLLGFAGDVGDIPGPANARKLPATENAVDLLKAAKEQLKRGKSSIA